MNLFRTGILILACTTTYSLVASFAHAQSSTSTSAPRSDEQSAGAPAPMAPKSLTDWAESISIGGDFRYRLERDQGVTADGQDLSATTYSRIRARMKVMAKLNNTMDVTFRLTTGNLTTAGKQFASYSNHVDLGQQGSKKSFDLDLAYVDYHPFASLRIQAGKDPNLFWTAGNAEIMWGYPWTLEGINAKYQADFGSFKPYAVLAYDQLLGGRYNGGRDVNMLGGQVVAPMSIGAFDTTFAIGSYNYSLIKDQSIKNFNYSTNSTSADGNSINGIGTTNPTYAHEFRVLDFNAQLVYDMGFAPLTLYYEYITNTEPSDRNKGNIAGFKIGKLKEIGTYMFEYNYRDVQADATLAMAGETMYLMGGTDVYGQLARFAYQAFAKANVGFEFDAGTRIGREGELYMLDLNAAF